MRRCVTCLSAGSTPKPSSRRRGTKVVLLRLVLLTGGRLLAGSFRRAAANGVRKRRRENTTKKRQAQETVHARGVLLRARRVLLRVPQLVPRRECDLVESARDRSNANCSAAESAGSESRASPPSRRSSRGQSTSSVRLALNAPTVSEVMMAPLAPRALAPRRAGRRWAARRNTRRADRQLGTDERLALARRRRRLRQERGRAPNRPWPLCALHAARVHERARRSRRRRRVVEADPRDRPPPRPRFHRRAPRARGSSSAPASSTRSCPSTKPSASASTCVPGVLGEGFLPVARHLRQAPRDAQLASIFTVGARRRPRRQRVGLAASPAGDCEASSRRARASRTAARAAVLFARAELSSCRSAAPPAARRARRRRRSTSRKEHRLQRVAPCVSGRSRSRRRVGRQGEEHQELDGVQGERRGPPCGTSRSTAAHPSPARSTRAARTPRGDLSTRHGAGTEADPAASLCGDGKAGRRKLGWVSRERRATLGARLPSEDARSNAEISTGRRDSSRFENDEDAP